MRRIRNAEFCEDSRAGSTMMSTQSVVALVFLLFWMIIAYKPWLQPQEYMNAQRKRRSKAKEKRFYSPQSITFSLFKDYPLLDLWSARIISILGILICVVVLSRQ
jgi:hypothetical protein